MHPETDEKRKKNQAAPEWQVEGSRPPPPPGPQLVTGAGTATPTQEKMHKERHSKHYSRDCTASALFTTPRKLLLRSLHFPFAVPAWRRASAACLGTDPRSHRINALAKTSL